MNSMLNIVTDPPNGKENSGMKDPAIASEIKIEQNVILLSFILHLYLFFDLNTNKKAKAAQHDNFC